MPTNEVVGPSNDAVMQSTTVNVKREIGKPDYPIDVVGTFQSPAYPQGVYRYQ